MKRHDFLARLHSVLRPRTYLETGVNRGQSMTISRVPSIGIDPEFSVNSELRADIHLARTSSDEFFARRHPVVHLPEPVVDLALIDGMHLSEYALRDYLAIERFTEPASVIVFDDMLPRSVDEAARRRHTNAWTGDVYKAAQALREMRPDLVVIEVDTQATGVTVVLAPDAGRDGVLAGYDDWLDLAMADDPQEVPDEVLTRSRAMAPQTLLDSAGWRVLREMRGRRGPAVADMVRSAFADVLAA